MENILIFQNACVDLSHLLDCHIFQSVAQTRTKHHNTEKSPRPHKGNQGKQDSKHNTDFSMFSCV